jgi:hypothetical protein|tara:strand:+ start:7393 stop:7698 length:306 start_codon:yes stop_codon:yes gene_type:complete
MSDGCSGVCDFGFTRACINHDRRYHYGGDVADKLVADDLLYRDMVETPGFWGWMARRGMAKVRYTGVRMFTYSYPPDHPLRADQKNRVEAFNWLGKGSVGV